LKSLGSNPAYGLFAIAKSCITSTRVIVEAIVQLYPRTQCFYLKDLMTVGRQLNFQQSLLKRRKQQDFQVSKDRLERLQRQTLKRQSMPFYY